MSVLVNKRTVVFSGSINEDSTAEIMSALMSMNGYDDESVNLIINSGGGNLDDGVGIYDCLKSMPYHINGIVLGQASSAAVLLLQGCDRRFIGANSIIMVHAGGVGIDSRHPNETAVMIKASVNLYRRTKLILAGSCGVSLKTMNKRMQFGSCYVGQEAVDAGFVDAIVKEPINANVL
jgi:ATP-dependent Clp protease protease subunit